MSLTDEYRQQFRWRDWNSILNIIPLMPGHLVLDLGCSIGDLSAELATRGARVIGIDYNSELLREATARNLQNVEFHRGDLSNLDFLNITADGAWCSFTAAYFPNLKNNLINWKQRLKPGAWLAMIEIDHLFGHTPLSEKMRLLLAEFEEKALSSGNYDFHMGGKMRAHLEAAGFRVTQELSLEDKELSFDGPAPPEVLEAWRQRFARMGGLQKFAGSAFTELESEFLAGLASPAHRSQAQVRCCIARLPEFIDER